MYRSSRVGGWGEHTDRRAALSFGTGLQIPNDGERVCSQEKVVMLRATPQAAVTTMCGDHQAINKKATRTGIWHARTKTEMYGERGESLNNCNWTCTDNVFLLCMVLAR